jgi:Flp pilus assembly protein TadD
MERAAGAPCSWVPSSRSRSETRSGRGTVLICAALVLATLLTYARVAHFDFVNYDDPDYVTNNPHVSEGLSSDSVRWAISSGEAANWFPVTRLSHLVDHELFGRDAGAQHLVNVVLHACAAVLLFLFLQRAAGCLWPSAAVAFLFALHPLHVESVAWISERKDVLCALFWFLTLLLYVRYAESPTRARYATVLLSFALALMSKPMAITLPLVMLLLDYWPLRRKSTWIEKAPFYVLAMLSGLITLLVQQQSGAVKTLGNFPLLLRIENALGAYAVYLGQTFWPVRLAVFYPFPAEIPMWKPVLGAALIIAVSAITWRFRGSRPYLIVGWAWFLITLLPIIGIVQVGAQSHADRYMYLPMAGLLVMLAWGVRDLVRRWPKSKPIAFAIAAGACAGCAAATTVQVQTWQNSGTLFEHALAVTKDNYIAEHNLGSFLLDQSDQLESAITHLKRALEINPNSLQAHSDLGVALAKSGRLTEAETEFRTALRIDPTAEQPRRNLEMAATAAYERGVELMKSKNTAEAIQQFQAAIALNPDYAEAHNNLGVAYSSTPGKLPEAIAEFEAAVRIKPDYVDAQYNLGAALAQAGKEQEALPHFEAVERLRPDPQVEQIIRQLSRTSHEQ